MDINRVSSSESISSESIYSEGKVSSVESLGKQISFLKKELEQAEKINNNLKCTINELDKKIKNLINEKNSYKGIMQIILLLSLFCNMYLYSFIK